VDNFPLLKEKKTANPQKVFGLAQIVSFWAHFNKPGTEL